MNAQILLQDSTTCQESLVITISNLTTATVVKLIYYLYFMHLFENYKYFPMGAAIAG